VPSPSPRAQELVRGAFDLHVHIEPDLVARSATDIDLARRFGALGLAGFVLKSHYVPTAERAAVVQAGAAGVRVLGSLTLNAGIGGLNPLAVEIAAREGARIIWMPTVDAENEAGHHARPPGAKVPVWAQLQDEFRSLGVYGAPVRVAENGAVVAEVRAVLEVVARRELVLATGHLSAAEIFAVVGVALEVGVRHVVVTHPDYPTQNLSLDEQRTLADQGALLERCFAPIHTGKVSWEQVFAGIRATGPERNVLSTDLGQIGNPPVEDGLALMADALLAAGFSEEEVQTMAVTNTRRIAGGSADG
jgi:hypothetical protein